jgi:formylglycine-generating enzyme required for sulfatase activity
MNDGRLTFVAFWLLVGVALVAVPLAHAADAAQATSIDPGAWIRHPQQNFAISAGEVTVGQFQACVDAGKCDAATASKECNLGHADRAAYPMNCVNFDGAQQYCTWVGGRLCTEDEWQAACKGTDERAFPYGAEFDAAACNVNPGSAAVAGGTFDSAPVGAKTTCQGGLPGLFDMAGNVSEWLNDCKGSYCKFRGAAYLTNDPVEHFSGCGGVCSGNQKTLMSNTVGIRCCRDAAD